MIKLILFDYDGTLFDTHGAVIKSITKVLEDFEYIYDRTEIGELIGDKISLIFKRVGASPGHISMMVEQFYLHKRKFTEIKKVADFGPLNKLAEKYPLIIISNTQTSLIKEILRLNKVDNLFKEVFGDEKFTTKDIMIKKLIREYKIRPQEVIYVGDRFSDIICSKKAGCISVAINNKYSWSDIEIIKKEGPDYIIKDFDELKELVEIINKNSK